MSDRSYSNRWLGLICIGFALLLLLVWIPLDTDSGLIEKVRRRLVVGDALAPSVAGVFILLGGAILLLFEGNRPEQPALTASNIKFILGTVGLIVVSLALMRYVGPLCVALMNTFSQEPAEYRLLRDTVPWKYLGYFVGGTVLVAGLITLIEGQLTLRAVRIAVLAVIVLIIVYDVPFEDLLLPPNGDV